MATLTASPTAPARPVLRRPRTGTLGRLVVLAIATFLTLGPVVWTLWTSLTPQEAGTGTTHFGLSAFHDVFGRPASTTFAPGSACLSASWAAFIRATKRLANGWGEDQ